MAAGLRDNRVTSLQTSSFTSDTVTARPPRITRSPHVRMRTARFGLLVYPVHLAACARLISLPAGR